MKSFANIAHIHNISETKIKQSIEKRQFSWLFFVKRTKSLVVNVVSQVFLITITRTGVNDGESLLSYCEVLTDFGAFRETNRFQIRWAEIA